MWCLSCLLAFLVGGCLGIEDVVNKVPVPFLEQDLTASALEKRIELIDSQYREPRSPASVSLSLETAEHSISPTNDYAALWRGIRACAWLAQNHPERSAKEKYGKRGIAMGKRAIMFERLTTRPEPFYYLALCLGAYCELKGTCNVAFVREMRDHASMALALDESFDHCGSHRFLGKLLIETEDVPGYYLGSFEEGLAHLNAAAENCPDFAENHLFLAEALIADGRKEAARQAIDRVLESPRPTDHQVEHAAWLESAAKLYREVAVDDEVSIQAAVLETPEARE